jgi:carbamate kinase
MRIVVALGGNALLKRGEPMTHDVQRANIRVAAQALAPVAGEHELVLAHGNSRSCPQSVRPTRRAGRLPPLCRRKPGAPANPPAGYMIEQELGNLLPFETPFATILTMVEVDPYDPAFQNPTKFVGPVYDKEEADRLKTEKDWVFKQDGARWRRVVPSPLPRRIFEIRPIRWMLEKGTVVICAGGGGIPTMYDSAGHRWLTGIEAVIDKDLASELLAREVNADLFVIATDVDAVYLDWGKPEQRKLGTVTPAELRSYNFPAGSMGPKVDAAVQFVERTGKRAAIGSLAEIGEIVAGTAGTNVVAG